MRVLCAAKYYDNGYEVIGATCYAGILHLTSVAYLYTNGYYTLHKTIDGLVFMITKGNYECTNGNTI
jgi:hypothetical protein